MTRRIRESSRSAWPLTAHPVQVQTLSEDGAGAESPQVAIDSSGRATVAWQRWDGSNDRIQSVRLAADGSPRAVATLSEAGETAWNVQLAVDSLGRATFTWQRYDGADWRVQAARAEIIRPETGIITGPEGLTSDSNPSFSFSSEEPGATFECRLGLEPFAPCITPTSFSGLADGPYSFAVRAVDVEGDTDLTPATRDFEVDTTPRRARISKVRIVGGPKKAKKGWKVFYRVKITNSGEAQATGVRVKVGGRGIRASASVGKIPAGKTRVVKVRFRPKKRGRVKAQFKVTSKNAGGKTVKRRIRVR